MMTDERAARSRRRPGARILLVEDTDMVRRTLTVALAKRGFAVTAVGSAEEALEIIPSTPVDLLLTDVVLPGKSGPALAAEFRRLQPGVPVLFMSGYSDGLVTPEDLDTPRSFLQKPFPLQELVERIYELITNASGGGGEEPQN